MKEYLTYLLYLVGGVILWLLNQIATKVVRDNLPSYKLEDFINRWKQRWPVIKYHGYRIGVITVVLLHMGGIIKLSPKTQTSLLIALCFIALADSVKKSVRNEALRIKSTNQS